MGTHDKATERHLPYGITPVTCECTSPKRQPFRQVLKFNVSVCVCLSVHVYCLLCLIVFLYLSVCVFMFTVWLVITAVVVSLLLLIIVIIVKLMQRRRVVNRYRQLEPNELTTYAQWSTEKILFSSPPLPYSMHSVSLWCMKLFTYLYCMSFSCHPCL